MSKGYTKIQHKKSKLSVVPGADFNDDDIFVIHENEDIPDELRKELQKKERLTYTKKLLDLMRLKAELTIDEIIIGFWRKYGVVRTRKWVHVTLYDQQKRKLVAINEKTKMWRKI